MTVPQRKELPAAAQEWEQLPAIKKIVEAFVPSSEPARRLALSDLLYRASMIAIRRGPTGESRELSDCLRTLLDLTEGRRDEALARLDVEPGESAW